MAIQTLYVRVGEAIRRARHAECLTVTELSKRIGITLAHLQKIEMGETACSLHVLVSLADEMDLSLDELVPVAIEEKELVA